MKYNDICLFTYVNNEDEYFLRSLNFDFVFKMKDGIVYYTIDKIDYIVNYSSDHDIYFNYGILKLSHLLDNKLLCIYNYNNIQKFEIIRIGFRDSRLIKNPRDEKYIESEINTYYYSIINKYNENDKYIFTNINEVLALLINCLHYNSPYLILKNIEQIKNILKNNNTDNTNFILKHLFYKFNNIYCIPVLLLLTENLEFCDYYYEHANKLYENYNILLKIDYTKSNDNPFSYNKIKTSLEYNQEEYNQLYFRYDISDIYRNISINNGLFKFSYSDYRVLNYNIEKLNDVTFFNKYFLKVKYAPEFISIDKEQFKKLIKIFIPGEKFNHEVFDNNILKATELYTYLIDTNKRILFNIQELIMGSGKTTIITPYICILLLNYFQSNKSHNYNNEIYIVMPHSLINSSFEILMKNIFLLFNNIDIFIYPNNLNLTHSNKYTNSISNKFMIFKSSFLNLLTRNN